MWELVLDHAIAWLVKPMIMSFGFPRLRKDTAILILLLGGWFPSHKARARFPRSPQRSPNGGENG